MSLFQIYYTSLEDGSIVPCYLAAADIESAIHRFRQIFSARCAIVEVYVRSSNLLT